MQPHLVHRSPALLPPPLRLPTVSSRAPRFGDPPSPTHRAGIQAGLRKTTGIHRSASSGFRDPEWSRNSPGSTVASKNGGDPQKPPGLTGIHGGPIGDPGRPFHPTARGRPRAKASRLLAPAMGPASSASTISQACWEISRFGGCWTFRPGRTHQQPPNPRIGCC